MVCDTRKGKHIVPESEPLLEGIHVLIISVDSVGIT